MHAHEMGDALFTSGVAVPVEDFHGPQQRCCGVEGCMSGLGLCVVVPRPTTKQPTRCPACVLGSCMYMPCCQAWLPCCHVHTRVYTGKCTQAFDSLALPLPASKPGDKQCTGLVKYMATQAICDLLSCRLCGRPFPACRRWGFVGRRAAGCGPA